MISSGTREASTLVVWSSDSATKLFFFLTGRSRSSRCWLDLLLRHCRLPVLEVDGLLTSASHLCPSCTLSRWSAAKNLVGDETDTRVELLTSFHHFGWDCWVYHDPKMLINCGIGCDINGWLETALCCFFNQLLWFFVSTNSLPPGCEVLNTLTQSNISVFTKLLF